MQRRIMNEWLKFWGKGHSNFKVIESGTIQKLGYGFLLHSNYGWTFSRFDTIHERDRHLDTQPQTDAARQHMPRLCIASQSKVNISLCYSLLFLCSR